jgi:CheY-like chemotaxis protein
MNAEVSAAKANVLVVDDEPTVLRLFERRLATDFSIMTAEDGPTALRVAAEKRPDMVLLDVRMPGMDGFEVLEKIRAMEEWGKKVPVIFITNVEMENDAAYAAIAKNEPAYYLMKSSTNFMDLISKMHERLSGIKA